MEEKIRSNNKSIFFEFHNISYSIASPNKRNINESEESVKSLDQKLDRYALPNEVLSIFGPSGSGKTSLLSILADRLFINNQKVFKVSRMVKGNNVMIDHNNFGKICGFVEQTSLDFEYLTPKELLFFGTKLKLKITEKLIKEKVDILISQFGLENCANTNMLYLSGGERKRTLIAYELITEPQIILLDEPTSGLDFFSASIIMKYLKKLAKESNKTITSSDFINYIDKIILLKEGEIIYQGEINNALNNYFPTFSEKKETYENPFDYFLQIIDKNNTKFLEENYNQNLRNTVDSKILLLNEKYKNYWNIVFEIEENRQVNIRIEIETLVKRNLINHFRNKSVFYSRFIQFICNSVLMVLFYLNLNHTNDLTYVINLVGFCFNCVNNFFSIGMYSTIYSIYIYKKVFTKEYPSKMYHLSSFYISTMISLFLQGILYSFIFTLLVNITIFQFSFIQSQKFFILNLLDFIIGASYGTLLGISLEETKIFSVAPFVLILSMLGSGVLRNNLSFPFIPKLINYLSHYRYLLELHLEGEGDTKIRLFMNFQFGIINCAIVIVLFILLLNSLSYLSLKRYASKMNL